MIDFPINNAQVVYEEIDYDAFKKIDASCKMMEIDLSFSNALAGMCSGESSSGPVDRPNTTKNKKSKSTS